MCKQFTCNVLKPQDGTDDPRGAQEGPMFHKHANTLSFYQMSPGGAGGHMMVHSLSTPVSSQARVPMRRSLLPPKMRICDGDNSVSDRDSKHLYFVDF